MENLLNEEQHRKQDTIMTEYTTILRMYEFLNKKTN